MQDSRLRIRDATVGIHVLLSDDLQGVGYTAGHNTCIEDWHPCPADCRKFRMLKQQCGNTGKDSTGQELDAGKFYSVSFRRKVVNDQNVYGE